MPLIQIDSIPIPNPNVASRIMEGEAVLVHPEKGKVKVVNALGAFIWQRLDGQHDVGQIVDEICRQHQVDPKTAEVDTIRFLKSLLERDLIVFHEVSKF